MQERKSSDNEIEVLKRIEIANRRLKAERINNQLKEDYSIEKKKAKREFDLFMQNLQKRKGDLLHEIDQLERYKKKLISVVVDLEIAIKKQ